MTWTSSNFASCATSPRVNSCSPASLRQNADWVIGLPLRPRISRANLRKLPYLARICALNHFSSMPFTQAYYMFRKSKL